MRAVFFERIELINGVKLHELNARGAVEFIIRHDRGAFLDKPLGALVAVMHGVLEQAAEFVDKAEINAPCVDPYAVEGAELLRLDDALLYLVEEAQHIPIDRAADPDGVVGEAVDFIQRYLFAVKRADYGSAARRAEIYRKNSLFTH